LNFNYKKKEIERINNENLKIAERIQN